MKEPEMKMPTQTSMRFKLLMAPNGSLPNSHCCPRCSPRTKPMTMTMLPSRISGRDSTMYHFVSKFRVTEHSGASKSKLKFSRENTSNSARSALGHAKPKLENSASACRKSCQHQTQPYAQTRIAHTT